LVLEETAKAFFVGALSCRHIKHSNQDCPVKAGRNLVSHRGPSDRKVIRYFDAPAVAKHQRVRGRARDRCKQQRSRKDRSPKSTAQVSSIFGRILIQHRNTFLSLSSSTCDCRTSRRMWIKFPG